MLIRSIEEPARAADSEKPGLLPWWQKALFFFACVSIGFLSIGRVELPGIRLSSWSISRTVFFFWLLGKLFQGLRYGWADLGWQRIPLPPSLIVFFVFVTLSLFPYFHQAGDYRYFLFAVFHSVVVADLFAEGRRTRLLLFLLGVLPGLLVVRGILADPSILDLSRMVRFGYPLDHPNTAGYLFSMSIPLSLAVLAQNKGWMRWSAGVSAAAQFAGLALSYSRAAWLGSAASLLVLAVMEKRLRKGVLAVGLFGLLMMVFASPLRERLVSFVDGVRHPDMVWRYEVQAAAVSLGMDNPLLGVGYGRDRLRSALAEGHPEFFSRRYIHHAHNGYTEMLSGAGVLGLAAFLWLLGSTLARLLACSRMEPRRDSKPQCPFLAASLVAFMVSGLGDVAFYHHETRIFFFTLLVLCWLRLEQARRTVLSSG